MSYFNYSSYFIFCIKLCTYVCTVASVYVLWTPWDQSQVLLLSLDGVLIIKVSLYDKTHLGTKLSAWIMQVSLQLFHQFYNTASYIHRYILHTSKIKIRWSTIFFKWANIYICSNVAYMYILYVHLILSFKIVCLTKYNWFWGQLLQPWCDRGWGRRSVDICDPCHQAMSSTGWWLSSLLSQYGQGRWLLLLECWGLHHPTVSAKHPQQLETEIYLCKYKEDKWKYLNIRIRIKQVILQQHFQILNTFVHSI